MAACPEVGNGAVGEAGRDGNGDEVLPAGGVNSGLQESRLRSSKNRKDKAARFMAKGILIETLWVVGQSLTDSFQGAPPQESKSGKAKQKTEERTRVQHLLLSLTDHLQPQTQPVV